MDHNVKTKNLRGVLLGSNIDFTCPLESKDKESSTFEHVKVLLDSSLDSKMLLLSCNTIRSI